ncbi:MAG TPA: HAD family hydrolase [bacterium]|nr:HAD family hydrolase [bacterium]
MKKRTSKAVFIDRDGNLIFEKGYISRIRDIRFHKRSVEALKLLKKHGFKIIVVTNQSGVARGYFPESFVAEAHAHIKKELKKKGLAIDAYYYCPHHQKASIVRYKKDCACRKPSQGMVDRAVKRFNIDKKNSFTIGDKLDDVRLGHNGGMKGILVLTGFGRWQRSLMAKESVKPDYIGRDFYDAAAWIIKSGKKQEAK